MELITRIKGAENCPALQVHIVCAKITQIPIVFKKVDFPEALLEILPQDKRASARIVLANDPRPSYQDDPERLYGLFFAGYNLEFCVDGNRLTVLRVEPIRQGQKEGTIRKE